MSFSSVITSFSAEVGSENDVTRSEEGTFNIESVTLRETQTESRANKEHEDDDAILSRDEAVSRDTEAEGVGARPKVTKTPLTRKNTPAILPKVASLYGLLHALFVSSLVHLFTCVLSEITAGTHVNCES